MQTWMVIKNHRWTFKVANQKVRSCVNLWYFLFTRYSSPSKDATTIRLPKAPNQKNLGMDHQSGPSINHVRSIPDYLSNIYNNISYKNNIPWKFSGIAELLPSLELHGLKFNTHLSFVDPWIYHENFVTHLSFWWMDMDNFKALNYNCNGEMLPVLKTCRS